ncbi:RNA polymerase sigma factor [Metabacillus sediminilitoris]|jgi:RNA polymerase sigma-70 factor (ECF subfamily)|uniref:RNA polymerase sigma factor n=1 Tax=Metabacillus sediminilitoris TaxID=2567941 RepID=A0A4S4C0E5_9BACI|nr:sigma-70 family RNA polymerase sigma factor [Metabacillus sediminilitoris]QGQ47819.1 sigma-70 family RNA polymerase sigma factor [Metabacillus sediminilitoris]THF81068.1 sigma-70 family RNA polymerase sigma factor [Metabacillus sediminilitoris]
MTEDELIKKAKQGNMNAFGQLVEIHYPIVEKFAYQLGNRHEEIEDITQEVFIRVYRFLDQFSQAKFSTWLYKITLNVTRDFARKRQSNLRKVFKIQQDVRNHDYPEIEAKVLRNEEDRILHIAIQKLDEKYRIPIVLYYFHDKKYDEIAEIMSISLSTVKTRLLRGKTMLKKMLEELSRKEGDIHG